MFNKLSKSIFLIVTVICISGLFTYIYANRQGGYVDEVDEHGLGFKVHWDHNEEQTRATYASVSKWMNGETLGCSEYASFSTDELDSTGVQNVGEFLVSITRKISLTGIYRGSMSQPHLSKNTYRYWSKNFENTSPNEVAKLRAAALCFSEKENESHSSDGQSGLVAVNM